MLQSSSHFNSRRAGASAEAQAVAFLKLHGYTILQQNFRFGRYGEIDIVCSDDEMLVFVEVKARVSRRFGTPEEAVTPAKQQALRRAAEGYLYVHNITDRTCRFDVIAIEFGEDGVPVLRHLQNAFV
jgi:putative endonuclease